VSESYEARWRRLSPPCVDCGQPHPGGPLGNKRCKPCSNKHRFPGFGLSRAEADRQWRLRNSPPCLDCGQPFPGGLGGSKRCRACFEKQWRNPDIAGMTKAERDHYYAMRSSPGCAECGAAFPGWRHSTLCRACASRKQRKYTKDQLIGMIRDWVQRTGDIPTVREWNADERTPKQSTVINYFGSWKAAIEAAGYVPRRCGEKPYQGPKQVGSNKSLKNRQMVGGSDFKEPPHRGRIRDTGWGGANVV
jgi:hypothetical protein